MTRIVVFGAGAIGCWVGGRLAAGGCDVTLVGRSRVLDELRNGLKTSELHGGTRTAKPALSTDSAVVETADLVLVTVKSAATAGAAQEIGPKLGPKTIVVSLQNGVRNVPTLREALPRRAVIAGMVPFNVIWNGPGHYHRASGGKLMFDSIDIASSFSEACLRADVAFELRDDMPGVQWAKLVMNLNNAINALCGLPLAAELSDHAFRSCLALAQREAIDMIRAAREPLARVTLIPTAWMPRLLTLPNTIFDLLAGRVVAIDPTARSSMWDDLNAKRPTEIDYINGEIVRLAGKLSRPAPVNGNLVSLIRAAEQGGRRDFKGDELYRLLSSALKQPTA
ncbi:MAG TPA: 2-dehydropantoate 2-reductase [Kofleriaceae bacterium]|nr:2-dehydropantoate 2-reductase [Kofleriaceae bacterium]